MIFPSKACSTYTDVAETLAPDDVRGPALVFCCPAWAGGFEGCVLKVICKIPNKGSEIVRMYRRAIQDLE